MSASRLGLLRGGAAAAAIVLAVISEGDTIVLGLLLAAAVGRPVGLAVVPALVAASWRFASTSLGALAGAQAVLGPAGLVGPVSGAAASWSAAAVLVLVTPAGGVGVGAGARSDGRPRWRRASIAAPGLATVALGVAAGQVVAGPSFGADWLVRVGAAVLGVAVAVAVGSIRAGRERWLDGAALVAALAAVVLATAGAPTWSGTVDTSAARTGALVAIAVVGAAAVGARAVHALGNREA